MKQILKNFIQSPVKVGAVLALATAIVAPLVVSAWGPSNRATFTTQTPASYVTFNSITDNPSYGDERNFVLIKEKNPSGQTFKDKAELQAGREYTVSIYFHNNAAENLNLVANDTRVSAYVPAEVKAKTDTRINGYISSSNANPNRIWDEVIVTAKEDLKLAYVNNSAKIISFGAVNGRSVSNDLFTERGALVGYDNLDGRVPGCNRFSGYVNFDIRVTGKTQPAPNFTIEKLVTTHGSNNLSKSVEVKTGDKVDFRIAYKNSGNVEQANVIMQDALPAGLELVKGSVKIANATSNGQYVAISNNLVSNTGFNIGTYQANANAFVYFTAKVTKSLDSCAPATTLVNTASVITAHGKKSDTASVVVKSNCDVKQIQVCELKTKKVVTIKEADLSSTNYSKNLDDCKTTPVTPSKPSELPSTGLGLESVASLVAVVSLVASLAYYVNSRKLA